MGCIYGIQNIKTGKILVGQTIQLPQKRWSNHKGHLKRNTHCNPFLQRSWNKNGEQNFQFYVIEDNIDTLELLNEREQFYINSLKTLSPNGFNLQSGGFNYKQHQSTRQKRSKSLMGHSGYWSGKTHPPDCKHCQILKNKIPWNKGLKGKQVAWNKGLIGRVHSTETKQRISSKLKGTRSGERSSSVKLTLNQVMEIRKLLSDGWLHREVALKFNVSRSTIGAIKSKRSWNF